MSTFGVGSAGAHRRCGAALARFSRGPRTPGRDRMSRPTKGDDLLVVALAQGKTRTEAGRIANVSDRTVRRRLQDPAFTARVNRARAETTAAAAAELADLY